MKLWIIRNKQWDYADGALKKSFEIIFNELILKNLVLERLLSISQPHLPPRYEMLNSLALKCNTA